MKPEFKNLEVSIAVNESTGNVGVCLQADLNFRRGIFLSSDVARTFAEVILTACATADQIETLRRYLISEAKFAPENADEMVRDYIAWQSAYRKEEKP